MTKQISENMPTFSFAKNLLFTRIFITENWKLKTENCLIAMIIHYIYHQIKAYNHIMVTQTVDFIISF